MARGAIISIICVVFFLPSLLMLCDKLICVTTFGMKKRGKRPPKDMNFPKGATAQGEASPHEIELNV